MSACRSCKAPIVWLKTAAGKNIPVDAGSTSPDDQVFDKTRHVSHFTTCPNASQHSKSAIARKVEHVKAGIQSRDHTCHWPDCGLRVPPKMWGCKPHWFALPKEIRDAIWNSYRPGQEEDGRVSLGYQAAARWAQEWIALQRTQARLT